MPRSSSVLDNDLAALQAAVTACDEAHAQRLHGTIGERPAERFAREQEHLLPLPAVGFDPRPPEIRKVLSDCRISFEAAYYSVPYRLVGMKVVVKADPLGDGIAIYAGDELVAEHRRVPRGQTALIEEHVADLRRPRLERLRARAQHAAAPRVSPGPLPLSVLPWPRTLEAAQRPIEDYLAALGGTP